MREPVALTRVAGNARANDVFPIRLPTAIPRHDVIQIEHLTRENLVAILTSVVVPLKNILSGELDLLLRLTLKKQKHDHAWHPNPHRYRLCHFRVRIALRKVLPAFEIMSQKTLSLFGADHLRVPLIEQSESTSGTARVHRLPEAVEN